MFTVPGGTLLEGFFCGAVVGQLSERLEFFLFFRAQRRILRYAALRCAVIALSDFGDCAYVLEA